MKDFKSYFVFGIGLLFATLSATVRAQQMPYTPNDPGQIPSLSQRLGWDIAWSITKNHPIPADPQGLPVIVIMGQGVVGWQHPDLINANLHQYDVDFRNPKFAAGHESAVLGAGIGQTDNGLGVASPGGLYYGTGPFGFVSVAFGSPGSIKGADQRAGLQYVLDLVRNQHLHVILIEAAYTCIEDDPAATKVLLQQLALLNIALVCSAGENTIVGSVNIDNITPGATPSPVSWGSDPYLLVVPITSISDNGTLENGAFFGLQSVHFELYGRSIPTISYLFDMTDGNARIGSTSGTCGLFAGMLLSSYLNTEQNIRIALKRLELSGAGSSFSKFGLPNLGAALLITSPTLPTFPVLSQVQWNRGKRLDVTGSFSANAKVFVDGQEIDPGYAIRRTSGQISFKTKPKNLHLVADPGTEKEVKVLDGGLPSNSIKITL